MSEDRVLQEWQKIWDGKQTKGKFRNALAGDGGGTVEVSGEPGYIWCRYSADQSKVSKIFSMERGIPEDFPILVGRRSPDDEFEQVLGIDWTQYQDIVSQDTVDNFNTSNHGESHNGASGADPAPIDLRNLIEMRGRAQATPNLTIKIERGQYEYGSDVNRYPGEDVDLTASVPGVAGHRYVLIYVDGATNAADFDDGVIVPLAAAAPIPDLTVNTIPICLVDLENGQTTITEDDIYDWRFLWKMVSNLAPVYVGTNAERLALVLANLAELTRFYTTDTDKIWEVWEAAWRLIYPPPALSDSAGNSGTPWATDASGNLIGDDGAGDSPQLQLVGGSNDDTADIFLDDSAVANESDLAINLPGTTAASVLNIRSSTGADKMHVTAEGRTIQYVRDAETVTFSLWQTLEHSSSGLADDGFAGRILYRLEDNGNVMDDAAALQIEWEDAAAGSEDTIWRFYGRKGGAALGEFVHFGATEAVFNENSADMDFRIESDTDTHGFFLRGSDGNIGIKTSAPNVDVEIKDASDPTLRLNESGDDSSYLQFIHTSTGQAQIQAVASAGNIVFDIDPIPSDGTGLAAFRFFRTTNTTAAAYFIVYKGDGAGTANAQIAGKGLNSYVCADNGDFGIGTATPGSITEWNMTTENLEFVDAGSVGATQQDWLEVQIGNVTGYIHVYAGK